MEDEQFDYSSLQPCSVKQHLVMNDFETDVLLVGGGAGSGKALRHGEKVLTPSGFVNIEDVKVDDQIITPKNSIEKITAVYPQGIVDIYRVTFQDGRTIDSCGNHLWEYHIAGRKGKNNRPATTLELKTIVDSENNKNEGQRKYLPITPLVEPLELYNTQELPVPAYTLGVILGDGNMTNGNVVITTADDHIKQKISETGQNLGVDRFKLGNKAISFALLGLQDKMRELKLMGLNSHNKFIPEAYKNSKLEDRWELVKGLMDSDGYVCKMGCTYYTSVSLKLIEDLSYVLQSLGFTTSITSKISAYKKNGIKVLCARAYTIYIRGREQKRLFSLKRKYDRTKQKDVGNKIVDIQYVGKDYATCISISGNDKLFITTNFIVTHNTFCSLVKALRYLEDPHARVTITRLSYPMLASQGGLIDESQNIYRHFGAEYRAQPKEWIFPNGARLKFVAMPKNLKEVQGWQPTNVIIDEGAEYNLRQVLAIRERLRSGRFKSKINMMITCNPDRSSFLYDWVEWCLDPETGVPRAGTEHIIKYMVVINNKTCIGDSEEELYREHGEGKILGKDFIPFTFRYIPMTLEDNPVLMKNNPSYRANLLNGTRVSQLRYLYGSWTAIEEGASYFERSWTPVVPAPPENVVARVRAWDIAHSVPTEKSNPDWTAGVLISRTAEGVYYIEDVVRFRKLTDGVIKEIVKTAEKDGLDVPVCIPQDGASGKSTSFFFNTYFAEHGLTIIPVAVSGHSSKLKRFLPFASLCENGSVRIVKAPWNEAYFTELERFDNTRNIKDDQVDATSDGFNTIARRAIIPHFTIPDLSGRIPMATL